MPELRFACDAMLGSLAKWLRFAGFDASYDPALPDVGLAATARREGRWLVTRDRRLAAFAGPRALLLRSATVAGQVEELRSRLPMRIDPEAFFTRCSACNEILAELPAAEARDRVPPYVAVHVGRFRGCSGCGRIYWRGTHTGRIASRLRELFDVPP